MLCCIAFLLKPPMRRRTNPHSTAHISKPSTRSAQRHREDCALNENRQEQALATPSQSPLPRLAYSIDETAQMLGVCTKTVRRLISRRLLRPSRALRHLLIPRTEIERFLKETL